MKTLITPQRISALAFVGGEYMPPGVITETDIAATEQQHIVPVVGRTLYEKLLDGAYADFTAEFLAPPVALFTRLAVQPRLDIQTGRSGTTAPRSPYTQPASDTALRHLQTSLRTQARVLLLRASEHLSAHRAEFPEYDPDTDILGRCWTSGSLVQMR